jgi:hypothetical protein
MQLLKILLYNNTSLQISADFKMMKNHTSFKNFSCLDL